jgi:DNA polymerase III epsilon subunit-like protein
MVDIETTGTSPDDNAIIQIAAVRFNPFTGTIDTANMFNRCLGIPPQRFWDEETRSWWMKQNKDILMSIFARMEDPAVVMKDFYDWAGGAYCEECFVAKPLSFDFPFVQSYFRRFGYPMPFNHSKGRDLRSFLAGLSFPDAPFDDRSVPVDGVGAHDAIFDVLHQIKVIFHALNARKTRAPQVIG